MTRTGTETETETKTEPETTGRSDPAAGVAFPGRAQRDGCPEGVAMREPPHRTPLDVAHPHLVEVVATGHDAARRLAWVAMRFVEAPSMQEVLGQIAARDRPLSSTCAPV